MRKQESPPVLTYWIIIGVMALSIVGAAAFGFIALNRLTNGDSYIVPAVAGVICMIMAAVAVKVSLVYRDKVEYDEFGQSRKHSDFSKLSAKERQRIEEEKMREAERLLPTTELNSMTHKGSKDPEKDIDKLIGLPKVKKMMSDLAAQMEYDKQYGTKSKKQDGIGRSYHMSFSGAPGTGKTTVARIMAGLFYKYRIITENKTVETDGNTFVGSTTSDSAAKTRRILRKANRGVLFIDEAYALAESPAGREVIATLIKEMEDNRDGIIIILAGYTDEMRRMIEANPGFKSRIQNHFYFDSYTMPELKDIFKFMAKEEGYEVSEMGYDKFEEVIEPMMRSKHFGNGRTVRNIVQSSIDKHKSNIMKIDKPDKERIATLAYEDITGNRN